VLDALLISLMFLWDPEDWRAGSGHIDLRFDRCYLDG